MKSDRAHLRRLAILAAVILVLAWPAAAQDKPADEGVNRGNYNIKQSFEVGGRFTDFTGNLGVYSTFVNLREGPRLLEHTLEMRSLDHKGLLFDDFFFSSFGYGGDPNSVSRLRVYKNRWYNFSGTFRRDYNPWDYNLLANPLNPTNSNPFVAVTVSPHKMALVRRMSDFDLTLLPQSPVRVRLGYTRNINEGPSLATFHEGTDVIVFQDWKTTLNSYSFGADFRVLPKTSFSYDYFFSDYKGDTTWEDRNQTFQLADGTPVDLGLIFNTAANQPCPVPVASFTTTPPTATATCNGYITYTRQARNRTSFPTSQFSFQTTYIPKVDLSGRVAYSSADNQVLGYQEFYQGLVTRTRQAQFELSGPASTRRVSATADLGLTYLVNGKFRVVDTFHFTHFRIPGAFDLLETSLFSTSMLIPSNVFAPGQTPPPSCPTATSPGCPQHNTSSPADIINEQFRLFLGQDANSNQVEVLYDLSKRFGGRLGYRYSRREITHRGAEASDLLFFPGGALPTPPAGRPPIPSLAGRGACAWVFNTSTQTYSLPAGCVQLPDGSVRGEVEEDFEEQTDINEHSALLGIWARPVDALRVMFDLELFSADETFTRISPRQFQLYRVRTTYRVNDWTTVSGNVYILEKRNNVTEISHRQHDRSYSFSAVLAPRESLALDFGYDFNDVFSQTNICFTGSVRPPGTSPCPTAVALFQQISLYDHDTRFGYFNAMWKPVRRLTTNLGYAVTSTTGSTLLLNPSAPPGPLAYNYHRPTAGLEFEMNENVIWKASWGYYGYNEKSLPDPTTAPRDFRGNLVLLAVRFKF